MYAGARRWLAVAAVVTGILIGSVHPVSAQAGGGDPPDVAYRKTIMLSNQQHMNALRTIINGEMDLPLHILFHTEALRNNGRMFADIFPEGSVGATSRARAEIWMQEEEFAAKLKAFADASHHLNAIAQRGFNDQTLTALNELQQTCIACHTAFREAAPPAG